MPSKRSPKKARAKAKPKTSMSTKPIAQGLKRLIARVKKMVGRKEVAVHTPALVVRRDFVKSISRRMECVNGVCFETRCQNGHCVTHLM